MNYRLTKRARLELLEAGAYYAKEDRRLLLNLHADVELALNYLCEFPKAAKPLDRDYRSYKLRRFPYVLIYRVMETELVVAAVAHSSRKPGYWRGREPENASDDN